MSRKVAVLGSTGSIGTQALDIIHRSNELELYSIVCGSSTELLMEQKRRFSPVYAASVSQGDESRILAESIEGADIVLNAIVGSAGLKASILVQEVDIPLALANKESLVVGAELLRKHLEKGSVIPVDSEHSTVFRCLQGEKRPVRRITLTASGGSLRDLPLEETGNAPIEKVLNHPTWSMGGRITVDSASMVNKAFEILEARALFPGIPVDAVIHRSSIVHSLVESADGAWKALLGLPHMKIPISWALHYPDLPVEPEASENPLDWGTLSFQPIESERYPAFHAVLEAGDLGGTAPAVANAADETAVKAFLEGNIHFGAIAEVIRNTVRSMEITPVENFDMLLEADKLARNRARKAVENACCQ